MRFLLSAIVALALALCALGTSWAHEEVFYNITSVEAKQMSNAVQIVFKADGVISPDMDMLEAEFTDWRLLQKNGWRFDLQTTKPMEYVTIHFDKARLQVNALVPVDKYPVSHVEFTPTGNGDSLRVDMALFLYTGSLISHVKSRYWDDTSVPGTDWGNNVRMEIVLGEDERSVVITVISDRLPDAPEHRTAEGLQDSDKELSIGYDGARFDVHAKNSLLSEFTRKLESVSGRRVELDPSVERLMTAELPAVSFDDLVKSVCRCYGLTTAGSPNDALVMREAVVQSGGAYSKQETQSVPLRWIRAENALRMLPNFLTRCVRVDKGSNQLVFGGSPEFTDKIRSDLALLDRPGKTVEVEASLVELSPTVDMETSLSLSYHNSTLGAAFDLPSVQFGIVRSEVSPAEFDAKLGALIESGTARVVSSAKLSALSGEKGTLFAGVNKYIQVRDRYYANDTVVPVKSGMSLTVKPLVTGERIELTLTAEVSSINVIDPVTELPVMDTRNATGTFRARSGESIVVGGLDSLQTHVEKRRLPVLGYLPIIGGLFTRTIKHREHSRLVLLLKPRIVEDAVATRNL